MSHWSKIKNNSEVCWMWRSHEIALLHPTLLRHMVELPEAEDEEQARALFLEAWRAAIRRYALALLSRRGYSEYELSERLQKVSPYPQDQLIQELKALGYLNDEELGRSLLRCSQAQHSSKKKMQSKERLRGLKIQHDQDLDEDASCLYWLKRWLEKLAWPKKSLEQKQMLAKLARRLQGRGFEYGSIHRALNHVLKKTDSMDDMDERSGDEEHL